jgi:hypothetical protein
MRVSTDIHCQEAHIFRRRFSVATMIRWRLPTGLSLRSIFRLDLGDVSGQVDPFLAKAASGAEVARNFHRIEDGPSDRDVVPGTIAANVAWDANDVG